MPSVEDFVANNDDETENFNNLKKLFGFTNTKMASVMQNINLIINSKEFKHRKSCSNLINHNDIQSIITDLNNIYNKLNQKVACFHPVSQPLLTYYSKRNNDTIKAMKIHHIKEYFSELKIGSPQYILFNEDETCRVFVDDLYIKTFCNEMINATNNNNNNNGYYVLNDNTESWMFYKAFESYYQQEPITFITSEPKELDTYIQHTTKEKVKAFKIINVVKTNFLNTNENIRDKLLLSDNDGHSIIVNAEYLNKAPNKNVINGYYTDYPTRPTTKWISESDFEEFYQLYNEAEETKEVIGNNNFKNYCNIFKIDRVEQEIDGSYIIYSEKGNCLTIKDERDIKNIAKKDNYIIYKNNTIPLFISKETLDILINSRTIFYNEDENKFIVNKLTNFI